jgi:uncharacterized membrane protein
MSKDLVVIVFDNMEDAEKVVDSLKSEQKHGGINLEDTAYVVKDEKDHVTVKNAMDKTVKQAAVGGGLLGLFFSFLFFGPLGPIGYSLIGAVAGGAIGHLVKAGVSKSFIEDVTNELKPGTSAVFFVIRSADAATTLAVLRQYKGKVLQTTLDSETENSLKRAVGDKSGQNPNLDIELD